MKFISLFEIIKVVLPNRRVFWFIAECVADTAAVSTSIPRGLISLCNNGNLDFNSGARNLKNLPLYILGNSAFDNLISVDVWLAKALGRFAICLLVNNNLEGKLVSLPELPIIFEDNFKTSSALLQTLIH